MRRWFGMTTVQGSVHRRRSQPVLERLLDQACATDPSRAHRRRHSHPQPRSTRRTRRQQGMPVQDRRVRRTAECCSDGEGLFGLPCERASDAVVSDGRRRRHPHVSSGMKVEIADQRRAEFRSSRNPIAQHFGDLLSFVAMNTIDLEPCRASGLVKHQHAPTAAWFPLDADCVASDRLTA